ncbi:hypothetical protein [Parabacteroides hominis]|uniref:DNA-binding protein n=1 Tax=Parabacteroides hominis TaxID=2763057 RepID=A0ABR7DTC9_9BACT|nr:hypothetical protein [Parabacteroides hominis]MBC5634641.1 hypothetical protein [Parabacteroides hominis]
MPTENTYQSIPSLRKIEIEYLALQISKIQAGIREFIGQKEARVRFGRQNVERWVKEGRLQRYKRPGKIEYRLEDLYKCALDPYDY